MPEVIQQNLYDFPKYYDLVFGSDWAAEFRFLLGCFEKYSNRPIKRLVEPACGTGRLLVRLAGRGYETAGLDLNEKAVEFCNARFVRNGYAPPAIVGDMSDFRLRDFGTRSLFHAAFNPINSFRHLLSEKEARNHLRCVGDVLRKGGLYLLGLHLKPSEGEAISDEAWSARRGHLAVNSYLWSKGIDEKKREERIGMTFDIYTPTRQFQIQDETIFRTYSAKQMQKLIDDAGCWEILDTYDFTYDLKRPVTIGPDSEDVMYVLRKR
ncbi:class I SAM-dependent methyltransferase [Thalassoroseus pseudoceratinae]|uniref:class I SAM-dependent methyltransferase n=1 Tax=Thalassoroseus pseudoceratinae TaxID=2713176 RepID=UPI0014242DAD|nr:class I SAM-dependent methyltransferase [Thalassoroseus pseudoceratinae]